MHLFNTSIIINLHYNLICRNQRNKPFLNQTVTLEESRKARKRACSIKNTNPLLGEEIDNLHQYQRQACLSIDGIEPCEEESEDQIRAIATNVLSHNLGLTRDETQFEIDKCNCLGQLRDEKQCNIICF